MIESTCPPCEPVKDAAFEPATIVVPGVFPCQTVEEEAVNPAFMPKRRSQTVTTDCFADMLRKMTSVYLDKPFDACK